MIFRFLRTPHAAQVQGLTGKKLVQSQILPPSVSIPGKLLPPVKGGWLRQMILSSQKRQLHSSISARPKTGGLPTTALTTKCQTLPQQSDWSSSENCPVFLTTGSGKQSAIPISSDR